MKPYLADSDFTLYCGDALDVLRELPDESVHCVITSPPYWGLRDYGVTGQLGLEPTPDLYVQNMVTVFREVRRVLRRDGTCWLNLGDSYASNGPRGDTRSGFNERYFGSGNPGKQAETAAELPPNSVPIGLKPKDLVGIPWRVAFALQADGWYLRSDIVWAKPNPMPESATDRPTKAHEYVFLLTRSPRYWFDQEAVREPAEWARWGDQTVPKHEGTATKAGWMQPKTKAELQRKASVHRSSIPGGRSLEAAPNGGRNIRSVWEIEQTGRPNGARHTLHDAYFDDIATEEQAYWLGFIYADGYLGRRHLDVELAEKDYGHLDRLRVALGSSRPVTQREDGRSRFIASSLHMADSLRRLGMTERNNIPDIPTDLVCHFMRGVFDGDGSAWSYLPSGRSKRRYAASLLGHAPLLAQIGELLSLRGKPKLDRGIHKIAIAAADDLARLYSFMYDGATVYLERKRREFPQEQHVAPDVWPIATQPYPEAHFATYPEELVRRCILAGCPVDGTVLDPFLGSGTSALVARRHGRHTIGIELNEGYCQMIAERTQQLSLLAEAPALEAPALKA